MRLTAYASKLYTTGICLFCGVFASVVFVMVRGQYNWFTITFMAIPVLLIIVCAIGILRGKPILTADETGIRDSRVSKETIHWNDILAFCHVPRVVRPTKGQVVFSPFDSWRPIHLWIHPPKASLLNSLQALSPHPINAEFPQAHFILIEFAGLDTPSSRLADLIRNYAPDAKEKYS